MVTQFFADFVKQCFTGDLRTCELRLSSEEKEYVSSQYRKAHFNPLSQEDEDGKIWYEVTID